MFSSDSATEGLLASNQHISFASSVAFAVIYGLVFLWLAFKTARSVGHRFGLRCILLLCLLRLGSFALRAVESRSTESQSDSGVQLAAALLLLAGYLFFVEGVMSFVTVWCLQMRGIELDGSRMLAVHLLQHAIVAGVSGIGIAGAIIITNAKDLSDLNTAKNLRIASGALFAVIAVALIMITAVVACAHAAQRGQDNSEQVGAGAPQVGRASAFLITLEVCLVVEAIYRIWSSATSEGFIVENTAIAVLIFLPEMVALLFISVVDFTKMLQPRLLCQKTDSLV